MLTLLSYAPFHGHTFGAAVVIVFLVLFVLVVLSISSRRDD